MNAMTAANMLDARAYALQNMLDKEFDRIIEKVEHLTDSELSDKRSIATLYSEEIATATRKAKMWKERSTKDSRPVAYEVQKTLKKRLEALLDGLNSEAISDSPTVSSKVLLASLDAPTLAPLESQKTAVSIAAPQSPKRLQNSAKKASLNAAKGLKTQDVKSIFEEIHKLLLGPWERAAALTALMVNGYLTGSCVSVVEWFKTEIGGNVCTRTLSSSRKEYREEGYFLLTDAQRIFNAVEKLAETAVAKR